MIRRRRKRLLRFTQVFLPGPGPSSRTWRATTDLVAEDLVQATIRVGHPGSDELLGRLEKDVLRPLLGVSEPKADLLERAALKPKGQDIALSIGKFGHPDDLAPLHARIFIALLTHDLAIAAALGRPARTPRATRDASEHDLSAPRSQ